MSTLSVDSVQHQADLHRLPHSIRPPAHFLMGWNAKALPASEICGAHEDRQDREDMGEMVKRH